MLIVYKIVLCLTILNNLLAQQLWSDPLTWGGSVPIDGENVVVPLGANIRLDVSTASLGNLTINGTLEFDQVDIMLTAGSIIVNGLLQIGSELSPYNNKAIITLTDSNNVFVSPESSTRGLHVTQTGNIEIHGETPSTLWTKIVNHANASSNQLETIVHTNWKIADELVLAPTDFYEAAFGASITHKSKITSITNEQITIANPLNAFYWGKLQYATNSGVSLTQSNLITPNQDGTPIILDERAEIGNLTRNIVIQSVDDDLWNNQGFGVHITIMRGGVAHINGLEIKRGGKRGLLTKYPIHWHMHSYIGANTLEDATGQYFKNSSINESANRGVVIHGTNGLLIQNNVIYNIQGHGIFTEDAVERRNIIDHNLVLHVRNPPFGSELKQHETGEHGSSGFWISNPDNTITNNVAADCGTFGFWLAFPEQPWGESISVLHSDGLQLQPNRLLFGVFDSNASHSNKQRGIMLDDVEIDNEGNTSGRQYFSTINGRTPNWPYTSLRRFTLSKISTWKNGHNGIWDRSAWVDNLEFVSADNCGRFFAGAGVDGNIERSLIVGTSLNHLMNGSDRPSVADFYANNGGSAPSAFATYHSTFDIKNNIVVNFPVYANERSGAFATEDYYIRPVDKGHYRNVNNQLINSHPGVKLEAHLSYYTLASAIWDPEGIWGPKGNYVVDDNNFLTFGKNKININPNSAASGGFSVEGPFYGFVSFVLHGVGDTPPQNQPYRDLMAIKVERLDSNLSNISTWQVSESIAGNALDHMRDFATSPSSFYKLTFPNSEPATDFQMDVENMLEESDKQIMAIEFDGNETAVVYMQAYQYFNIYSEVDSLDDVINSSGATFWQDRCNDLVWVNMQGGVWQFWTTDTLEDQPSSDELLYETMQLKIVGQNDHGGKDNCSFEEEEEENNEDEESTNKKVEIKNYPNPFSKTTNISFSIVKRSNVKIKIINTLGKTIEIILDETRAKGDHSFKWHSKRVSSGVYFLQIITNHGISTKKITVIN